MIEQGGCSYANQMNLPNVIF